MKILRAHWFSTAGGTIGIVHVKNDFNELGYYISAVAGKDEKADMQYIADWGSPFPTDAGDVLFGLARVEQPDFDGPMIKMFRD